jgi:outer membrane protein OmpA-like peptidoglycan-associated protein
MGCLALASPVAGQALELTFPAPVLAVESRVEAPGSYAVPIAAFDGAKVPTRIVTGAIDQRAYRLEAPGVTTLALEEPLRQQLTLAGFKVIFECASNECGGFDFRFGTEVMAEPDMHVDMGDYRFLVAEKPGEVVSLMVSRSSLSGFVQVTRVGEAPLPPPLVESTKSAELGVVPLPEGANPSIDAPVTVVSQGDVAETLTERGSVVLEDLSFGSGAGALKEGDYASLKDLAALLAENPDMNIALVGHTDASGNLASNIALSKKRAESVRRVLIDRYGLAAERVTAEGVGFLSPRATNQTDEGQKKNRRVEAIVTSTR